MDSTCSLGLGVSPRPWRNGSRRLPTVNMTNMFGRSFCLECSSGKFHVLRFGMTFERLNQILFHQSTSYTADSHARTSARQAAVSAWMESEARFTGNCTDSSPNADQLSFFSKMSPESEPVALEKWSGHLPMSGMTVDGRVFQPNQLAHHTYVKGGFFWPTIKASDAVKGGPKSVHGNGSLSLPAAAARWRTPQARDGSNRGPTCPTRRKSQGHSVTLVDQVGGMLNTTWVEWLMGYNSGWTVLNPWAMPWFRNKRKRRTRN